MAAKAVVAAMQADGNFYVRRRCGRARVELLLKCGGEFLPKPREWLQLWIDRRFRCYSPSWRKRERIDLLVDPSEALISWVMKELSFSKNGLPEIAGDTVATQG